MTVDQERARSFGSVAEQYDRVRPDYPAELIDDVLAYAALGAHRAVEVGAGTGKATLAFAGRRVPITAVEPDPQMAAVLQRKAREHDVEVVVSGFEGWTPRQAYGLLYCGQAWHWVDPAVRWELAADALAPGGAIALFWNRDRPSDDAVSEVLRAIHAEMQPATWREAPPATDDEKQWAELSEHPRFTDFRGEIYRWRRPMATADFVANLGTLSAYLMLGPEVRDTLFAAILDRLDERIELTMDTVLYLARRR
jgi:trans-aconitate methyltransferase